MKRTELKRKTPLRARGPMKRSRARRSASELRSEFMGTAAYGVKMPARDPEYLAFVRTLPCSCIGMDGAGECSGPIEASHTGPHGTGTKADDRTAIAKCHYHHIECWHKNAGPFKGRTRQWMREWARGWVDFTQSLFADCPF